MAPKRSGAWVIIGIAFSLEHDVMRSRIVAALLVSVSFPYLAVAQGPPPNLTAKSLRESLLTADKELSAATGKIGFRAAIAGTLAGDAYFLYDGVPVVS